MSTKARYPATVVRVLASDRVVINRGSRDGVLAQQRFVVYSLDSEPIKDPHTGQDLGQLEIPKGVGVIVHVQDQMAILYNSTMSFSGPRVGDFAKPV
jgi:hypothetical protein